ncbi:rhodanese-like domain-containing protein [Massilia sp. W12]|uniref:rhodanese-like domain-containing protein n=1 Tax=Massilia sp. W12 TaxID=3126507 RepID=UPI0030CC00C2
MHPLLQQAMRADLPFAGELSPADAFTLMLEDAAVLMIDVRTDAERAWVGKPDLPPSRMHAIEWNRWPGGVRNPDFLTQLQSVAKPEQALLFLCRSGVRSRQAAEAARNAGFMLCFDILQGFEGDKDSAGHRKTLGGWCVAGLPWVGA